VCYAAAVLKREILPIDHIYVPVKRRATLDPRRVQTLAESILQEGQKVPILVRADGDRWVLVEGLHRLEACKALGEATIAVHLVDARKH
jgi:sulfiredoxin